VTREELSVSLCVLFSCATSHEACEHGFMKHETAWSMEHEAWSMKHETWSMMSMKQEAYEHEHETWSKTWSMKHGSMKHEAWSMKNGNMKHEAWSMKHRWNMEAYETWGTWNMKHQAWNMKHVKEAWSKKYERAKMKHESMNDDLSEQEHEAYVMETMIWSTNMEKHETCMKHERTWDIKHIKTWNMTGSWNMRHET
jgi:hypothetical protein